MSNQILQAGRALAVIPSDDAGIPFPAIVTSGTNTDYDEGYFVDDSKNFIAENVKPGDILYNITQQRAATVTSILTSNSLALNALDVFTATGDEYIIYQQSPQTGNGNMGCVFYVGGAGDVEVTTTGNDSVTFFGVNAGSFVPVHVLAIGAGTTATNIVALW